jgi:hypothetical protein
LSQRKILGDDKHRFLVHHSEGDLKFILDLKHVEKMNIKKEKVEANEINTMLPDSEEENELLQVAYSCGYKFGNTGVNEGPAYGELVKASFKRILIILNELCEMNKSSKFLDLGCGLGKPNIHIAIAKEVALSIGIENQELRYNLGITVLQQFNLKTKTIPYRTMLINADIAQASSFVSTLLYNYITTLLCLYRFVNTVACM